MIDLVGYSGIFQEGTRFGGSYSGTEYRCSLKEGDLPLSIRTHEWWTVDGSSVVLFQENFFTSIPYYKNTRRYRLIVDDVVMPISKVQNRYAFDGTVAPEIRTFVTPNGDFEMRHVRTWHDSDEFNDSATWCDNDLELLCKESYSRNKRR